MKNISKWFAVLASVFCLTLATSAMAEEGSKPCADDAAKFCKDMKPGDGRIARCMKEHSSELSAACKDNIEKGKERMHDAAQACKEDASKLCADVKRGGGRIVQCLKQHEGELSSSCKDEMSRGRK